MLDDVRSARHDVMTVDLVVARLLHHVAPLAITLHLHEIVIGTGTTIVRLVVIEIALAALMIATAT